MQKTKMKKIGQGWQYTVYDYEKKVMKVSNSRSLIKKIMLIEESKKITLNPKKFRKTMDKLLENREKSLVLLKKQNINLKILGNPKIIGKNIEQDKVIILGEKLKKTKNPKKYIDKSIKLIFELWKHGFSESVYNLTVNNGVDKNKDVILTDFGEITFDKNKVKRDIKNKRWLKSWSFRRDLTEKIKNYYEKKMEKEITIKNLNKYWKKFK